MHVHPDIAPDTKVAEPPGCCEAQQAVQLSLVRCAALGELLPEAQPALGRVVQGPKLVAQACPAIEQRQEVLSTRVMELHLNGQQIQDACQFAIGMDIDVWTQVCQQVVSGERKFTGHEFKLQHQVIPARGWCCISFNFSCRPALAQMKVLPRMFFRKGFLMKHIPVSRGADSGLRRLPWSEAALLVIGAALAMHASTQRALPNLLMDGRWKSEMVGKCRATPGCIGLTVTPVRTSWLGYRWQLAVQTSTGTSSQVEASLRAVLGWPRSLYIELTVHDSAQREARP